MEKLKAALKNKNLDHLYFFSGDETFLSAYYINQIKKLLIKDEQFDMAVFDSDNIAELQEAVEGVPVFSENKLVVVKGQDLSSELKAEDVDFIAELLENIPYYTILIFCTRTIKGNSRIYKLLKEKCTACEFPHQKPAEIAKWLVKAASACRVTLTKSAADLLIEYAGVDMTTLATEINKLSTYCGEGGTITDDMVEKLVMKSVDAKIYLFLDAILGGESEKAFRLLSAFKTENEKPIYINASVMGTIRTLLEYIYLSEEGKSAASIADKLRLRPIQAKKYAGYMRKIDKKFMEGMLKNCVALDIQMKQGADGYAGLSIITGEMLCRVNKKR